MLEYGQSLQLARLRQYGCVQRNSEYLGGRMLRLKVVGRRLRWVEEHTVIWCERKGLED